MSPPCKARRGAVPRRPPPPDCRSAQRSCPGKNWVRQVVPHRAPRDFLDLWPWEVRVRGSHYPHLQKTNLLEKAPKLAKSNIKTKCFRPLRKRRETLSTWKTRSSKIPPKKPPQCQEEDFVQRLVSGRLPHPRLEGQLRAVGAPGCAGREPRSRLQPRPSVPWLELPPSAPPPSKSGRASSVVAPHLHGGSLWVYRHLGTPPPTAPLPGQMLSWARLSSFLV